MLDITTLAVMNHFFISIYPPKADWNSPFYTVLHPKLFDSRNRIE